MNRGEVVKKIYVFGLLNDELGLGSKLYRSLSGGSSAILRINFDELRLITGAMLDRRIHSKFNR
jgi:hypothetical protein